MHSIQLTDALRATLTFIGWTLTVRGKISVNAAAETLTARFETDHGLAPATAHALAHSAIHFWDEAGIVVIDYSGQLSSRTRHVIELAAARYVANMSPSDRPGATGVIASEPTLFEIAGLVTALHSPVAQDLVAHGVSADSAGLLFAILTGIADDPLASSDMASKVIEALSRQHMLSRLDPMKFLSTAAALPAHLIESDRLLHIIDSIVEPSVRPVWKALLAHRRDAPAAGALCRQVVQNGPPPRVNKGTPRRLLGYERNDAAAAGESGIAFSEVVLAAAKRLGADEHELAERIQAFADSYCTVLDIPAILEELGRHGYPNDRPTFRREGPDTVAPIIEAHYQVYQDLFERLAKHGSGYELRVEEQRRLSRLSMLDNVLSFGETPLGDLSFTSESFPGILADLAELLIDLCGIDRAALAAECEVFLQTFKSDRMGSSMLLDLDPPEPLVTWPAGDPNENLDYVVELLSTTHSLAAAAAKVLVQVPVVQRVAVAARAAAVAESTLSDDMRRIAAHLALDLDGAATHSRRWATSSDLMLRIFAIEKYDASHDPETLFIEALTHEDALLRDAAAFELMFGGTITPSIAGALSEVMALPNRGTCRHCRTPYSGTGPDCTICHRPLPDPQPLIAQLIESGGPPEDDSW